MQNVLYIGTDAGVFTAHGDGRGGWQVAGRALRKWEVTQLAVTPHNPNKVFAATRGDGVWRSEDFGKTWAKPSYGRRGPGKVRGLTIDPHEPKRLYAACEPIDIFVSEDDGQNWQQLDAVRALPFIADVPYPLAHVEPHARDIAVDPKNPDVIYGALQLGHIIKSMDRGRSWTRLDRNIDCDVHTISIDPVAPQRITVATGGHGSRRGEAPGRALYVSDDAGANWTPTGMNFEHTYSVPLVRDPHNSDRLYSALAKGTAGAWRKRDSGAEAVVVRSDNGGKSWREAGTGMDRKEFPEAIVADSRTAGVLHAACRNGDFYTTEDAGDSWRRLALGVTIDDLSSLALSHS